MKLKQIAATITAAAMTFTGALAPQTHATTPVDDSGYPTYRTWSNLMPGSSYYVTRDGTQVDGTCTIGAFLQGPDGDYYALTARHCRALGDYKGNYPIEMLPRQYEIVEHAVWLDKDGNQHHLGDFVPWDYMTSIAQSLDVDLIRLNSDVVPYIEPKIGGAYRIVDTLNHEQVHQNPSIKSICKFGARTMETCGPEVNGSDPLLTAAKMKTLPGDSGGPAYVKLGGNDIALVGVMHSVTDDQSASYAGNINDSLTNAGYTFLY